jgi:hypothetical protein
MGPHNFTINASTDTFSMEALADYVSFLSKGQCASFQKNLIHDEFQKKFKCTYLQDLNQFKIYRIASIYQLVHTNLYTTQFHLLQTTGLKMLGN